MANWSIISGSVITRADGTTITVASSADDVKPSNAVYVSPAGNDTFGNGSRLKPYKTRQVAIASFADGVTTNIVCICGTGVYRDAVSSGQRLVTYIADGYVVFDMLVLAIGLSGVVSGGYTYCHYIDIILRNFNTLTNIGIIGLGCVFENGTSIHIGNVNFSRFFSKCVFNNIGLIDAENASSNFFNCTFINIKDLRINLALTANNAFPNNIYKNCNIQSRGTSPLTFSLFHNCNFRFNATQASPVPANLPETSSNTYVPTGYTRITDVTTLQTTHAAFAGYTNAGMAYNAFGDPLFLTIAFGNYSLSPSSPAKNMSYSGDIIGARGIGIKKLVSTDVGLSDFENAGATGMTIANDSLTITTPGTPAVIESKVMDLGKEYPINSIEFGGSIGDRNGDWPDSSRDLEATTIPEGTDVLEIGHYYVVESANITWNGSTLTVGTDFLCTTGLRSFSGSGVVRRILEVPNRATLKIRFSSISSGDIASQPYYEFEWGKQPRVNRAGNVGSGAITASSGSAGYIASTSFPVYWRFWQEQITLRDNNLV